MVEICQFGAGQIGKIHAANIAANARSNLRYVVDVDEVAAAELAVAYGAKVVATEVALDDAEVDAVLIASSTNTHANLIEAACEAGKAIFCEKPIDLDIGRVDDVLMAVEKAGVPMMVGFNRRFDPTFAALHDAVAAGSVGRVEMVAITSRDPEPPPIGSYVPSAKAS